MSDGAARFAPAMLAKVAAKKAELARAVLAGEMSLVDARREMGAFISLVIAHVREHGS